MPDEEVPTIAAPHGIEARAANDDIVAGVADDDVGVFVAAQTDRRRRGRIGGLEHLDLRAGREAVARAGPDPVGALAGDLDDVVGPIVDVVGVVAGAALHRIGAGAAIERIVAAEAAQHVRAVHAHELVDAVISPQDVGVDRTGEVFDAVEGVAFSVAARSPRPSRTITPSGNS